MDNGSKTLSNLHVVTCTFTQVTHLNEMEASNKDASGQQSQHKKAGLLLSDVASGRRGPSSLGHLRLGRRGGGGGALGVGCGGSPYPNPHCTWLCIRSYWRCPS